MFALVLALACANDSPVLHHATIQVDNKPPEHWIVLGPCPLTRDAYYDRLVRLMGRPDDEQVSVVEVPPLPKTQP
jgi:hypothetical protein